MFVIDFETRSRCDLRKTGSWVYATDPSTEILCLGFSNEDGTVKGVWDGLDPGAKIKLKPLFDAIADGQLIVAHNALFERSIWQNIAVPRLGFPAIKESQWRCTLAACSRLGLPRSLEEAGKALGLPIQKDLEGRRLMLKLCKPDGSGAFPGTPAEFERLRQYCLRDVETEVEVHDVIADLTPSELKVWQLDQLINLRGLPVDREALLQALAIAEKCKAHNNAKLSGLTDGAVSTPQQVAALLEWLESRGLELSSLTAGKVAEALKDESLPEDVREALQLRQDAGKASTAKLKSMLDQCGDDDRVRGTVLYHGAATGRWAGTGIQIQNFPRGSFKPCEIELVHGLLSLESPEALDLLLAPPLHCLSSALRSFIRAEPGKRFLVCDFAGIEARVLAWITGQSDLVEAFRSGSDAYKAMAAEIYHVDEKDVTKEQRQMGKTAILGCGYAMGHKKFALSCKLMAGVQISNRFAKHVIKTYRAKNDRIAAFWREINTAAIRAIETGLPHYVGKLVVRVQGEWLKITLPSNRELHYREPDLVEVVAPWSVGFVGELYGPKHLTEALEELDVTFDQYDEATETWTGVFVPKEALIAVRALPLRTKLEKAEEQKIKQIQFRGVIGLSRKYGPKRTYGGSLTENIVQAIARDFLAEAMLRVEAAGYPIVATIHDEIVSEVPYGFGTLAEFEKEMARVPRWGAGCPIGVEGFEAERYRK
jgi:DNA polymerase